MHPQKFWTESWMDDWEREQRFQSSRGAHERVSHDHDHEHEHDHHTATRLQTTRKGLAIWWLITLDESSPQWVPARTPTVHWGRYDRRPWVARSTLHRAKSRTMTEHWDVTTDKQDVQLNSTRLTQAIVFHNLCRDQHEISTIFANICIFIIFWNIWIFWNNWNILYMWNVWTYGMRENNPVYDRARGTDQMKQRCSCTSKA